MIRSFTVLAMGPLVALALMVAPQALAHQGQQIEQGKCQRAPGANYPGPFYAHFDTGKSAVRPADKAELKKIALQSKQLFVTRICIIGAADKVGDAANNKKLAQARANAVAKELMAGGVQAKHLLIDASDEAFSGWSFGKKNEEQQQDRRVTIIFAK